MNATRIISIAAAAAFSLAANAASAQGGYGSLSHFSWKVEQSSAPKVESAGVRAVGGYMFSDYVGIEAHVASGGTDDLEFPIDETTSQEAEAELNKAIGVFAKLNLPLNMLGRDLNVYALSGYAHVRVDILAENTTAKLNQSSFAGGAGIDIALVPQRLYLTADYVEYASGLDLEGSAASLGLRLSF